jgi:hypothetical protein
MNILCTSRLQRSSFIQNKKTFNAHREMTKSKKKGKYTHTTSSRKWCIAQRGKKGVMCVCVCVCAYNKKKKSKKKVAEKEKI